MGKDSIGTTINDVVIVDSGGFKVKACFIIIIKVNFLIILEFPFKH